MAKRYGNVFDSLLEGIQVGEQMQANAQKRKAGELEMQSAQMKLDDAKKARDDAEAGRQEVVRAMNPGNPGFNRESFMRSEKATANGTEQPAEAVQAPKVRMFDAYEKVARDAFSRGDAERGQKFLDASVAQKTMHYTNAINSAIKARDHNALASVLSDQPLDPYEYRLEQIQDGSLVGARYDRATGQVVGAPQKFESFDHAAAMVQRAISPGDISARLAADAKRKIDEDKARSDITRNESQNKKDEAQARGFTINAELDAEYGPQERAERIRLLGAQTNASNASARNSRASAGSAGMGEAGKTIASLRSLGVDDATIQAHILGKGDRSKTREAAITETATKLATSYNSSLAGSTNPRNMTEFLGEAAQLVDGAANIAGTSRVGSGPRPGPRPENTPQSGQKSYSNLWK